MRKIILIGLIGLGVVTGAFGKEHLETATFKNDAGRTFIALYVYDESQCTEVHIFTPEGKDIGVRIEAGTTTQTVDEVVLKMANAQ
jgi:hypothetical protein